MSHRSKSEQQANSFMYTVFVLMVFVFIIGVLSQFIPEKKKPVTKEITDYIITCRGNELVLEYNGSNILETFEKIPCDQVSLITTE